MQEITQELFSLVDLHVYGPLNRLKIDLVAVNSATKSVV